MPVKNQNPNYADWLAKALKCRYVSQGPDAVKAQGDMFLPKGQGMDEDSYKRYKERASFYNATARTIDTYVGLVFYRDPSANTPDRMADIMADFTLDGCSFNDFARRSLSEDIAVGRYGVLVDWDDPAGRPKAIPYTGESIVNWYCDIDANGRSVPVMVTLQEPYCQVDPKDPFNVIQLTRYRVLALIDGVYVQRVFTNENAAWNQFDSEVIPTKQGKTLDHIPFYVINTSCLGLDPENPFLLDLAEENVSHYRSSADLEHALHFTALPQPYIIGVQKTESGKPLLLGSSNVWLLPEGSTTGMLEFQGHGVGAIRQNMLDKEARMASLGARLIEGSNDKETATAAQIRNIAETASLTALVKNLEHGLVNILQEMAEWIGVDSTDISVSLNTEFTNSKVAPTELVAYTQAWQAGSMSSAQFVALMQQGDMLDDSIDADAEIARLEAKRAKDEAYDDATVVDRRNTLSERLI